MWDDEQDLRAALQRVVDGAAPPPATRVEEVIRRGRRRVLITRIGTVASAIVAVVGIGVGASALGNLGLGADGERLPPAGPAVSTPPVPMPESPRPGWTVHEPTYVSPAPTSKYPDARVAPCQQITLPAASGREVLPEEMYLPVLLNGLSKHYQGDSVQVISKTWVNVNRGLAEVAVHSKDRKLQRTFSLSAGRYGGPLAQAAEYYASAVTGGCAQKMHWLNLPGGAVVQASSEGLRAFTPSGRWYQINGYEMSLAFRTATPNEGRKPDLTPLPENVIVDLLSNLAALG
ncbi:hypothetical protein [Allokutzneria sp. NRRL B-24872]|uniref:hypothetical protein n=1 Tax=Allokutzneria sp. NRRL B-24872 TaxID=1137961 RepID=UPI001177AB30|nr:hypothetical protein [Allokutzneria sp. NRRL B-24872]